MREFAVVIGDCVHNLRSTLDYIAWELAGANPNDRDTMFPIFDDRVKFGKHGAWRIKNVPSAPRALIEKKQPYNTPDPKMSALWAIERFDTADKHRLLTVTVPVASSLNITPTRRSGSADRIDRAKIQYRTSDLVDNAIIAVVAFAAPTPNVEVKAKFTPQIAFSDRDSAGLAMHVIPNLRVLLAQVDRTIADFAGFF